MCSARRHVRFTPNSDRESGHRQTLMSALPPKADMCGATRDVRFGPIADIAVSFNYVVGNSHYARRNGNAKCLIDKRGRDAKLIDWLDEITVDFRWLLSPTSGEYPWNMIRGCQLSRPLWGG